MDRGRRRIIAAGAAGIGFVGVGLVGAGLAGMGPAAGGRAPAEDWFPTLDEIYHDPDAPVLGNPKGDVTVVEFFDYQCPFCRAGHAPLLRTVEEDGNTRLVLKDWPIFGAVSVRASQLGLGAATLGRYSQANAAMMAIPGKVDERKIDAALQSAGIAPAAAMDAYRSERAKWDGLMQRNDAQAGVFNLPGTPAYFIGEDVYPGAIQVATLRDAIARARGLG